MVDDRASLALLAERMRNSPQPTAAGTQTSPTQAAQVGPPLAQDPDALAQTLAALAGGTTDAAALGWPDATTTSGTSTVITLDAQNPETAALRAMLLRAVGQAERPATDPGTEEKPS